MPTGPFWNEDNPLKPWGAFDPDSVIDIPFDWNDYFDGIGSIYGSHVVTAEEGLEVVASGHSDGKVTARFKKETGATLVVGRKYWIRCHIVAADGQEEDQTLYLKVREK